MKYFISFVMVIMLSVTTCYAANSKYAHNLNSFETITGYEDVSYEDIKCVAKRYVPSKYQSAFFTFTECETEDETKDLMIQILATGYWESGWKVLRSSENKNGTYDLGYLALNTANINNTSFMDNFGLKDESYVLVDDVELYLIVCINFYKYLYSQYGADASYCYNCGEGKYINLKIPNSTYRYVRRINECVEKFIYESNAVAKARIERERELEQFIKDLERTYFHLDQLKLTYEDFSRNRKSVTVKFDRSFNTNIPMKEFRVAVFCKSKKEDIEAAFKEFGKPNKDYICIGYIRKYGNLVAPVFKNIKTGEKFIC